MSDGSTDNEKCGIDLTVSSPNAIQKAQAMLSGYDIDEETVTGVSIQVFEKDEITVEEPAYPPSDAGKTTSTYGIDDDERAVKGIEEGCGYHLVLLALEKLEQNDELPVTANEMIEMDMLGTADKQNVSSALSQLYRRKLADRNDDGTPYRYYITDYGRAELNDKGRDVTAEDAGGVYDRD